MAGLGLLHWLHLGRRGSRRRVQLDIDFRLQGLIGCALDCVGSDAGSMLGHPYVPRNREHSRIIQTLDRMSIICRCIGPSTATLPWALFYFLWGQREPSLFVFLLFFVCLLLGRYEPPRKS